MRIALGIEYDGSNFRGWQTQQTGVRTVQGCLEEALSQVAAHAVDTVCAGRTDAGVHGIEQVVHFDTDAQRPLRAWLLGVNSNLPGDINLVWVHPVAKTFHARFSALSRYYRYIILNRPYRSALQRKRATWQRAYLNHERMAKAATYLLGEHDFTSFRATGCQAKSPIRTIYNLTVERYGDYIAIEIEANGFLHHMVRNVAGVLMSVGRGEQPTYWPRDLLKIRNRTLGGVTAPAEGLYLARVRYAADFGLPCRSTQGAYTVFCVP
jgi:tRNA pseudouridine38-40 synthase